MDIFSVASGSIATAPSDGTRDFVQATPAAPSSVAPKTAADVSTRTPSPEQVDQAVKQMNDDFIQKGENLYASIEKDKATGINVIKILDKNTREVISQFPSKEIVAIAAAINQAQGIKGRFIHVSA